MENYVYPPYAPYPYRFPQRKGGPGAWRQRGGGGGFPGYGEAAAAAAAAEYLDHCQRAQLKAILSQVSPGLTPRLRKANTREVGVQVNPRRDASVQCSLGPRPLLLRRRGAAAVGAEREREREREPGSPAARAVRFPRTIAVYSPVASRRLTAFPEDARPRGETPTRQPQEGRQGDAGAQKTDGGGHADRPQEEEEGEGEGEGEAAAGSPLPGKPQGASEEREQEEAASTAPTEEKGGDGDGDEAGGPEAAAKARKEPDQSKTRVRFQFLEQKYGYYHCKNCNIRWESAYVWCVQGTNKVYFRQFCRTCQKSYNPYRVEDITCQSCKQTRCSCPVKLRHVDPKRPHRQDLCGRCKGKRLSCDSTFSFKYII